jgi:hypothetical protein
MSIVTSFSPTAASTAAPSIMSTTTVPLHHAVNIKLNKNNFLLWRAQLLPYLRSSRLIGYLDGTLVAPAPQIAASTETGELVPNPTYEQWYNTDQQLLSGLLSSMSEEVLRDVIDATTSKEVWDSIRTKFSSSTRACTVQLRVELTTVKKGDLSAADYFHKVKNLASEMAAVDAALRDDDVLAYLLARLPSDYDPFVTSITTKDSVSLEDVYAHLVTFEARQLRHHADLQLQMGSSANYAGRGGQSKGRGGGHSRGHGGGRSRGGAPSRPNDRRPPSSTPRPICQICSKAGHTPIRCWYRMDDSYSEEPPSVNVATSS